MDRVYCGTGGASGVRLTPHAVPSMLAPVRRLVPALLLANACSDYELSPKGEPEESASAPDTGPIPSGDTGTIDCPDDIPPPGVVAVDETCATEPEIGAFDPVTEWHWTNNPTHPGYHQIMAQPVVANLTDDNGDGAIDEDDVPDVVFSAFGPSHYRDPGVLVAVSGADGQTLWSTTGDGSSRPYGCSGLAIADVDGSGPSIFGVGTGGLTRYDASGAIVWTTALPSLPSFGHGHPAVGDLDGDGRPEIVLGPHVVATDGTLLWSGAAGTGGPKFMSVPVDLDGDGLQEVVAGNTVYASDGSTRWTVGGDGFSAVADLDLDGSPEIIITEFDGRQLRVLDVDGNPIWTFPLTDRGGGPPTVADYDGDGFPEIGLASEQLYRVIEHDGTLKWANTVQDASSQRTGSAVFDFEGDGAAEVVYADEETLWVYDGASGTVEMAWTSHSSGTLYEYPVIVDVDNDGAAEIVAAANDYGTHNDSHGIVVVGDATSSWSPARPIWNQHAYSITNIRDDGRVPAAPLPSWASVNSFRAGNSETRTGLAQPDLVPVDPTVCTDTCAQDRVRLWPGVGNAGAADLEGRVEVSVYRWDGGDRTLLRTLGVDVIAAGESIHVGPVDLVPEDFGTSGLLIRVDDDGTGNGAWDECDESDNTLSLTAWPCD